MNFPALLLRDLKRTVLNMVDSALQGLYSPKSLLPLRRRDHTLCIQWLNLKSSVSQCIDAEREQCFAYPLK
ncbi:hypothetical protein GUJ93_ZPchr0004g40370 [Zizania palustris]|uniref:Uncharacterized protein n=1 Tax=Zizania palustris TaxID=103762 RepID=A0A8J5SM17_ZIZPA|nr:hypothetical protein GUJ93_ZPchr0004g40370 [Zizania palustris]